MAILPVDSLPLGFRFRPTDQELVNHYLKRKINGRINSDAMAVIPEVDVCKCEPWDLPDKSVIRSDDLEWFFFSPRDRKHPKGARHNRATDAGYWKATGKDRLIKSRGGGPPALIGMKKTLVFYQGRAPQGVRTYWIMHEYRTTEPEFESGEQGQFVLCRLFKKLEENNPSTNADEVEGSGFSPAPTRSSPSDTHHGAGALETFATPLKQKLSETNLQDNLQPLPFTVDKQPAFGQRRLVNEADCATSYPPPPEESHCNSNMTSNVADHEAEIVGVEDDLAYLLGLISPDYEQLGSEVLPHVPSPQPDADFRIDDYFSQELSMQVLLDADAEDNPVTEFFESNQEDDVAEFLNFPEDLVAGVVPAHQVCSITPDSPLDSVSCKDSWTSDNVDAEHVLAKGGSGLFGSGLVYEQCSPCEPILPHARSVSFNMVTHQGRAEQNVSSVDESSSPLNFIGNSPSSEPFNSTDYLTHLSKFTRTGHCQNFSSTFEESTTSVNFIGSGIEIRNRQPHLSSTRIIEEQGSAIRRLRLQSCKKRVPTVDTESSNNNTDRVVKMAMAGGYSENQIAQESEVSGPHLDEIAGFSDHDNTASTEIEPIPETSQEYKPSVRLRRKSTHATGNELKGKSLHPQSPRPGSVSVIRMTVVLLVFLLLPCVGIWYSLSL